MIDKSLHKGLNLANGGAMGWPVNLVVPLLQFFKAFHVGGHIAIGWANNAG